MRSQSTTQQVKQPLEQKGLYTVTEEAKQGRQIPKPEHSQRREKALALSHFN